MNIGMYTPCALFFVVQTSMCPELQLRFMVQVRDTNTNSMVFLDPRPLLF